MSAQRVLDSRGGGGRGVGAFGGMPAQENV